MTSLIFKPLPNAVSPQNFSGAELQRAVMLLMENIKSIHAQLGEAARAVAKMQSMSAAVSLDIDEEAVAENARIARASAQNAAISASSAMASASAASASQSAAALSADTADESAAAAAGSADRAETAAAGVSGVLANFAIRNVDIGSNVPRSTFYLEPFGADAASDYKVKATFTNEGTVARSCTLKGSGDAAVQTVSLAAQAGDSGSAETTVRGNGFFIVDNIAASVAVEISISLKGGE